jgi:tryptophan 2,3-dioxygenase
VPTYGETLRLDEMLTMQERIADVPDALFFIAIHQITELWFMVILHELELARSAMDGDDLVEAGYRMDRVGRVIRVLVTQLDTLESLSPNNFLAIRANLAASSGLQSAQFREIEFLSGCKDPSWLDLIELTASERHRLERRLAEPTLADAFTALCHRRGHADLAELARTGADPALLGLIERLLDHDQGFAHWRARHALMVERLIGHRTGTGGSAGVSYLRSTTGKRFFPRLWEVRSIL